MKITILVVSSDQKNLKKFWTHTTLLRRLHPDLDMPIPVWMDDPNNLYSLEADIQASDITVCLISPEWLADLEGLTDMQSDVNLLRRALLAKRANNSGKVLPVILSRCQYGDEEALARLQVCPRQANYDKKYSGMKDEDWADLSQSLSSLIKQQPQASSMPAKPVVAPTKVVSPVFCMHCGDELPANASYCRCGASVKATQATTNYVPAPILPAQNVATSYYTPSSSVRSAPAVRKDGLLIIYSTQDKAIAQNAMRIFNGCGLRCIDCHDVPAGARWREVFLSRVQSAQGVLFLLSADLMSEMQQASWQETALTLAEKHVDKQASNVFAAMIRYCADSVFGCQTFAGVDGKPIAGKHQEESWLSLGQHLAAVL